MTRIFLTLLNVFHNFGMSLQSFVRSFGTVCVQFFCRRLTETVALRTYVLLRTVPSRLIRQQKDRDGGVGLMGERVCFEAIRGRMTGKQATCTPSCLFLALFLKAHVGRFLKKNIPSVANSYTPVLLFLRV